MTVASPLLSLCLLVALVLAPTAAAHPAATIIEAPNGERCYIFWNDSENPEFWVETNGRLSGGVPEGTPLDHYTGTVGSPSGLQRASGPGYQKDTKLSEEKWTQHCVRLDD